MSLEEKDLNPFRNAKMKEERDLVWKSLQAIAKPISKEEALRRMKEAVDAQKINK